MSPHAYRQLLRDELIRKDLGLVPVPTTWLQASSRILSAVIEDLGGEVRVYGQREKPRYYAKPEDIDAAKALIGVWRTEGEKDA